MSVALATNISTLIREYVGYEKEDTVHNSIVMDFFSEVTAIHHYVMDQELQITDISVNGTIRRYDVLTYSDGSQWVLLKTDKKMRFCCFLYLQDALKRAGADKVMAAPNKMAIWDNQIIYLSQYCGETRSNMFDDSAAFTTLSQVGYEDRLGGCNMRKKEDAIYVCDTEPSSFNFRVYRQINSFIELHDTVYSVLETRVYENRLRDVAVS